MTKTQLNKYLLHFHFLKCEKYNEFITVHTFEYRKQTVQLRTEISSTSRHDSTNHLEKQRPQMSDEAGVIVSFC